MSNLDVFSKIFSYNLDYILNIKIIINYTVIFSKITVYPSRKNLKIKINIVNKKNRYLVKFFFNNIDKKRRILNRYEKHCKHFVS